MRGKPSLSLPTQLYFGRGRADDLAEIVMHLGHRVLLVTSPGPLADVARKYAAQLTGAGAMVTVQAIVDREPTLAMVEKVMACGREVEADVLVGFGGGSCLDTAKAAAGFLPTGRAAAEFFAGLEVPGPGLPWVAVPTTAGSGAEVTPNAVLIDPGARVKKSIRNPYLAARVAIVDPMLTLGLPPEPTVHSGLDALSHAIEAFTSTGSNELTDILAVEAARLVQAYLPRAAADGSDPEIRSALSRASLLAGIAFANARLGAVHGLAGPIGALYGLPHGLVCGVLMPQVMRFNLQVSYKKYARLAETWGVAGAGDLYDRAFAAIRSLVAFNRRLGLPAILKPLGLLPTDLETIAAGALPSDSLAANPRPANMDDLLAILRENL